MERQIRCCTRCHAIYRKEAAFCPSDGAEIIVTDEDPLVGKDVEHYTIEALIGEGAMGRVYRAHHRTLVHKRYALKVLLGDLASTQTMRMRFVNEAKSASRLSHPNVVSVVDFGRTGKGLIYLVMELVDGVSIADLIEAGPLDPVRAARLTADVARGLQHAHELGLVHRDLKPENVLVVQAASTEIARVVDFGIAISNEKTDIRLTSTGMAMGTPGYVAPEQVSGTEELDARADQYALGVSLYEMLTGGTLPFMGDPMDVVTTKVSTEAPALATRMPEGTIAPPGLARIVEKMIARKPDRRFADMAEVAAALDRFCASRGSAAETETAAVRVAPSRRRTPLYAALGLAVIAGGTAVAWTLTHGSAEAENAPTPVIAKAEPAAPPHPTPPPPATPPTPAKPDPTPTIATEPDPIEIDPAQTVDPPTRVRPAGHKPSRTRKPTIVAWQRQRMLRHPAVRAVSVATVSAPEEY